MRDDGVLADADIAMFLLHPIGLTSAVIVGAFSLGILFAEQGTLMVIGFGAMEDRRVSWLDALRYIGRYGRQLVMLAGRFLLQVGLLATRRSSLRLVASTFWFLRAARHQLLSRHAPRRSFATP